MNKLMENSKSFVKKYSTDVDNTNYLYEYKLTNLIVGNSGEIIGMITTPSACAADFKYVKNTKQEYKETTSFIDENGSCESDLQIPVCG